MKYFAVIANYVCLSFGIFMHPTACLEVTQVLYTKVPVELLEPCHEGVSDGPDDVTMPTWCAISCRHLPGCVGFQVKDASCMLTKGACDIEGPGTMYLDSMVQVKF